MRLKKNRFLKTVITRCLAAGLLSGCGGVSEEQLAARESAIAMMESGNYEAAVDVFNGLVEEAKKVTEFELDILKYRAEAEFLLKDYEAALHTYRTLMEVDQERPEYCYMASMALSGDGQMHDAKLFLEGGKELDKKLEAPGFYEASLAYADACKEAGETEIAMQAYQELIDGGFGNTELYNRLVMNAMEEEDYAGALQLVAEGLAQNDSEAIQELKFNEAVCYEYLGEFSKALELFRIYAEEFGSNEQAAHEIAFLETR